MEIRRTKEVDTTPICVNIELPECEPIDITVPPIEVENLYTTFEVKKVYD